MKRLLYIILFLPVTLQAQVIVGSEQWGGGVVTTTGEGSIKEDEYGADGIIFEWTQTLKDFERFDGAKEIDRKVKTSAIRFSRQNGQMPALPEIIDENGIDLFLLTKDGITIYMAMDAPSYLQETDDDLVKWIRYYAYQKRNYTARLFKRYEQWEARIKDEFSNRGVPEEIAELCMVESGCTYEAVSPVGAVGMWQIMPETGRAYKLTINQFLDERKNPQISTEVAGKILRNNYNRIGEWTLSIAAYNCGSGRILNLMKKTGPSWERMRPHLPKETQQYIPSLLAIHYVWKYREKFNL